MESFEELVEDIKPLLPLHWEELALHKETIPLEPDFEFYRAAYEAGILKFFTGRMDDGSLIAYAIYAIRPKHAHYQTTCWAVSDIVFVHPDHRNLGVGNALFDFIEDECRMMGVDILVTGTKVDHPELRFLLTGRGHKVTDTLMAKEL
jgi:GNAT superfamily N-acetyltransferase